MSRMADVPVFYRDDNDVCARPMYMTRALCREARDAMRGKFFDNGKKFRLFTSRPKIYPVTAADLRSSNVLPASSTISTSELLANVGIAGLPEDVQAPRHLVKRAQQKIRAYPSIRDEQAPTAFGRWHASEALQVTAIQ